MLGNTRGRRFAIITCSALIPLSLLCFWLVNETGFPRRFAEKMFGPDPTPPRGSAPPYLWWDIRVMILMLIVCGASSLYLLVEIANRFRRSAGG